MRNGGLAEITTVQVGNGRTSIKVGNTRLLDIVGSGADMLVECKGSKHDPVRADPDELLKKLTLMLSGPNTKV